MHDQILPQACRLLWVPRSLICCCGISPRSTVGNKLSWQIPDWRRSEMSPAPAVHLWMTKVSIRKRTSITELLCPDRTQYQRKNQPRTSQTTLTNPTLNRLVDSKRGFYLLTLHLAWWLIPKVSIMQSVKLVWFMAYTQLVVLVRKTQPGPAPRSQNTLKIIRLPRLAIPRRWVTTST